MDALELESAKQSPAVETAKDLFSGAVGGIAQVLIGMFNLSSAQMRREARNCRGNCELSDRHEMRLGSRDKLSSHREVMTGLFV